MHTFQSKSEILEFIEAIDPLKYGQTRNSLNGAVTCLSPYITAGVIILNQVKDVILSQSRLQSDYKMLQQLAWRDYFQSVYLSQNDKIFEDFKSSQSKVVSELLPKAILDGNTGILAIDRAVSTLYNTGYIRNHERMWLASIICNIAGTKWQTGAAWMYYYLIDGDFASNMLSWQWVAGTFSSKKYYANQENLNKYSGLNQFGTFLDRSYEELATLDIPKVLDTRQELDLSSCLSIPSEYRYQAKTNKNLTVIDKNTINSYYITPESDYILFIDTGEQNKFPICQKRLDFIISMIKWEIPSCQVLLATSAKKEEICSHYSKVSYAKQVRMFPSMVDYYPSFFKFWDKASKLI
jgi:deoxyribodipyrimidine photo-lyase